MVAACMVTPCINQRQMIYQFSIICLNRLPWLSLNIQTVVFLISGDLNRLEINKLLTHFHVSCKVAMERYLNSIDCPLLFASLGSWEDK